MNEDELKQQAIEFARSHRKAIARELTDPGVFVVDKAPVSVFMAGSPGAGKTEFSKAFLHVIEKDKEHRVVRIDADELRERIPGYTGANSYLFQGAVSVLVEKIHDIALDNKQSFIFDGTFAKYEKAKVNIERSLHKNRQVIVFYVYQEPGLAWRFTQSRELTEGRNIQKEIFVREFIESGQTVRRICEEFGDRISVFLIKKNFDQSAANVVEFVKTGSEIDGYVGKTYTEEELKNLL